MVQTQEQIEYDLWSKKRDELQASCTHTWSHVKPHYCTECKIKKQK
tara:strand:- start:609 stop:746 length:138 start_codon:yes stop_codon:yes gene_type:complete